MYLLGKDIVNDGLQKNVETYRRGFAVRIPVKSAKAFVLKVTRQGCADKGVCYPPLTSSVSIIGVSGKARVGGMEDLNR